MVPFSPHAGVRVGRHGVDTLMNLVAVIIPIIIGMILGNLDEDMRSFKMWAAWQRFPFAFWVRYGIDFCKTYHAVPRGHLLGPHDGGDWRILIFSPVCGGSGAWQARRYPPPGNAVATRWRQSRAARSAFY